MKLTLTLFVFCLLSATSALGQSFASVLTTEPQVLQLPSHDLHASQRPMQEEQNLLISSTSVSARGERPLWEAGAKPAAEIPLGDVARRLRSERATAKKAVKVLEQ